MAVLADAKIEIMVLGTKELECWMEVSRVRSTYPNTGAVGPDEVQERDHVAA
jgi:hypothetical protein